ncbi:DUF6174 domain-containing protein [Labilibaculum sp.]|uniref:DUF6174 domain-containing protein n=1 Tax=Labilibaculum sp. TaxID=2060723 RepID=UPI00356A9172
MKPKLLLFYLFISLCLISCDDENDTGSIDFDEDEFVENLNNWNQLNLQNYSYEYSNSGCSGTGMSSDIGIEMVNGEVESAVALVENGIQGSEKYLIDDLFAEIRSTYEENEGLESTSDAYLEEIEVIYNEEYFYPEEVRYIYHIPEGYDGLWNFYQYITNFEPTN